MASLASRPARVRPSAPTRRSNFTRWAGQASWRSAHPNRWRRSATHWLALFAGRRQCRCKAIAEDTSAKAFDYTTRGNMVAVISNGTAILGLSGGLGALAAKPVMEGKAVLFKRFVDIDSIDHEMDTRRRRRIRQCRALSRAVLRRATNWRTSKAPECFVIEERLRRSSWTFRSPMTTSTERRSSLPP